jgi:hypothetical protein
MSAGPSVVGASRWQRLAQVPLPPSPPAPGRCDLCAGPVQERHRHLLDLGPRALLCACRACAVLFDRQQTGGRRFRLVPERCRRLEPFTLSPETWDALDIPVALTFLVRVADLDRVIAFCPSALGVTDTPVHAAAWAQLHADNPVLVDLEDDVEALLVHRARGAHEHWLAPIDVCYRLAAVVRTHWRGLAGGQQVWTEIGRFFENLAEKGHR